jgi:short-subunit dehydrogenase
MKNIAIVTGASSGLGKEFVKLLITDQNINEIFVLARSHNKLNELKNEYGDKIRPYPTDLSDINNIKAFGRYLEKEDVNIKLLINNAGFAKFCSYNDISIDESLNMINLNVSGVVAMGLVCIPFMNKNSHIINIASQASFQPLPYQNIYSSTKSFVKNYSRALNVELKEKGITVTAVCPGWIKTNLFNRGCINAKKGTKNFAFMVTPDVVAKKALKDAYKNKDISVYGLYVNFCRFLSKVLPEKIVIKIWLLQHRINPNK